MSWSPRSPLVILNACAVLGAIGLARSASGDEMPTSSGPSGLLHTPSALVPTRGTLRGAFFVDWFRANDFLCTHDRPCGGARPSRSDAHQHSGATVTFGATPVTGLEAYLTSRVYTNGNTQSEDLHQVIGDTTLGAKYARPLRGAVVHLGVGAEAIFGNGPGGVGVNLGGTSVRVRALSSYALDALPRATPVRIHFALGYVLDNSGVLVREVEHDRTSDAGARQQISRIERYGLGINKVDRLELNLGAEWLTLRGRLRPFVEYGIGYPINRQRYRCPTVAVVDPNQPPDTEGCLARAGQCTLAATPSKLTLGVRATPITGDAGSLSVLLGLDIGVTGTRSFVAELAPQAPYTVWLGVALTLDTAAHGPNLVLHKIEAKVATPMVTLRGFVHPAGASTPIADALVSYVGVSRPPLSTDQAGNFGDEVPAGTYELRVRAPGYKENTCGGTAVAAPNKSVPNAPTSVLTLDCPLEPLPSAPSAPSP